MTTKTIGAVEGAARATAAGLVLLLLTAVPGHAEMTLLSTENRIKLTAEVWVLYEDAAVCRVVDDGRHGDEYQRIKSNDGLRFDVWKIHLSLSNHSGERISNVSAYFEADSPRPDCSYLIRGEVAEGLADNPYVRLDWDSVDTNRIEKLDELRVVASDQPGVVRWWLEYNDARGEKWRYDSHGPDFVPTRQTTSHSPGPAAEEKCKPEGSRDRRCWMAISGRSDCYLWRPSRVDPSESLTWTGECAGGLAQGEGTVMLYWDSRDGGPDGTGPWQGRMKDGKKQGHWVEHGVYTEEGPYVDGKRHGHWVFHRKDGTALQGSYVNGGMDGRWTNELPGETVVTVFAEGETVDFYILYDEQ